MTASSTSINETPDAIGIQFGSATYGRVKLYIGGYYDGFIWLRHVNQSGKKSAWVQYPDRFYAFNISGAQIGTGAVTAANIANGALTNYVATADNTYQTIGAGATISVISVTSGANADTAVVEIEATFKNVSGGARTFDVSIERADGTVRRSYGGVIMADDEVETFFARDKPSGNHVYHVRVTAAAPSTVSRRVIEVERHER